MNAARSSIYSALEFRQHAHQVIIQNICGKLFDCRGLTLAPRSPGAECHEPSAEEIVSSMEIFGYVRIDALRAVPRGARDWTVVFVLHADGAYSRSGPDLGKLLAGVENERPAKDKRLDEIMIVAEEEFFSRKPLTEVVRGLQSQQAGGADRGGAAPFYNAYKYHVFALPVLGHHSVPAHRLMTEEEVADLLGKERITVRDLPVVFTSDPPVIWIGGRQGQVVEITRDSRTTGRALYYRRVENDQ